MKSLLVPLDCNYSAPLSYLKTDRFKTEMLTVSAAFPIDREETPLTSLLLSVLRRGTEAYPTLQAVNRRLDSLYGTELSIRNFYRGDYQVIGFSLDLLGAKHIPGGKTPLKEALDLICQILYHPLLDENGCLLASYVKDEKRYQQDVIRSIKNNPAGYAMDRCQTLFYADRPCGFPIYGNVEDLESVTPERLTEHWKKIRSSFSPVCFFIGSLDALEVENALRATLWKENLADCPKTKQYAFSPMRDAKEEKLEIEDFPSGQSHLCVGLTTGTLLNNEDYYAMQVYNEILLGASPVSKLFLGLREKQSLCYSCASYYRPYTGALFIRCGLAKSCRELAEEEIRRQMNEVAKGRFSTRELEAAKNALATAFHSIEDSPEALENYFFGRSVMGLNTSLEESRQKLLSVTKEDVIRAAKKVKWDTEFFLSETMGEEATDDENDDD